MAPPLDPRVLEMLQERYCNEKGVLCFPLNLDKFRKKVAKAFPDLVSRLPEMLESMDQMLNAGVCRDFPLDKQGFFKNRTVVAAHLERLRPDLGKAVLKALNVIEEENVAAINSQNSATTEYKYTPAAISVPPRSIPLAVWINNQYLEQGFIKTGFIGWKKFIAQLVKDRPSQESEIRELISKLRMPGSSHKLPDPVVITNLRAAERIRAYKQAQQANQTSQPAESAKAPVSRVSTPPATLQSSVPSSAPSSSSRVDMSLQSQHVNNVQNVPIPTSNVRSTSDNGNGVDLVERIVDSNHQSTPTKLFEPHPPLQATALADPCFSFDFSSPASGDHTRLVNPENIVYATESEWESDSEPEEEKDEEEEAEEAGDRPSHNSQPIVQTRVLESNPPLPPSSIPLSSQPVPSQRMQILPLRQPEFEQCASSGSSFTSSDPNEVETTMDQATSTPVPGIAATHHASAQRDDTIRSNASVETSGPEVPPHVGAYTNSGFAFDLATPAQIKSVVRQLQLNSLNQRQPGASGSLHPSLSSMEADNLGTAIKGIPAEEVDQSETRNEVFGSGNTYTKAKSPAINMDDMVWATYRECYCGKDDIPSVPMDFQSFSKELLDAHPESKKELKVALKKFSMDSCIQILERWPQNASGFTLKRAAARGYLNSLRIDLDESECKQIVESIQTKNVQARREATTSQPSSAHPAIAQATPTTQSGLLGTFVEFKDPSKASSSTPSSKTYASLSLKSTSEVPQDHEPPLQDDILGKKLKQLQATTKLESTETKRDDKAAFQRKAPDFQLLDRLLAKQNGHDRQSTLQSSFERGIQQAPLLTASVISEHHEDLIPQYGLLGSLACEDEVDSRTQLLLNTNAPFSAFICGVQGSGKSHTTSCILENAVLASPNIGHLESPASTLVFSYGEWSSGGAGFNISEATFLGGSHPDFPGHHVDQITVLYSPSNPAIKKLYERLPNVKTVPFRLKAKTLDIGALHTLMAVDEKATMPLYMATVEAILRGISSESKDGSLDYLEFKRRLAKENFDSVQSNMLKMRMNLLESFLDLTGSAPEPSFKPGEVTIMDLSDPFVTPSTACILFKLGLENFLQSRVPSKMVVLDEAHKYMLNTPGSKILTDYLTRVIRLQRHQGARVVISTQEPTIATDLIALCSITVMHRFTSPTWYAALRRHINAVDDDKAIMQQIENLDTGEALVYAPNAVLGKNEDGSLVKATGRLMKVSIRNRVTLDGGASIMAV
ncbi:hypothetical protein M3J09_012758 [Ascochyta lentis]